MRTIPLPSGEEIPALGQGTWYPGEDAEVTRAALQFRAEGTCDYVEGRLHGSVLGGT